MKKISIVFVAALSLAAFSGCKKKGGDCKSTIDTAVDRLMSEGMKDKNMTPDMKKQAEAMMKEMAPKMKSAMTKSCTDDKWSADVLKCINDAKAEADMDKCQKMLTKEQQANVEKAMSEAMGMPAKAGGDEDKAPPAEGSAAPAPEGSAAEKPTEGAAAAAGDSGDLPKECQDYKAAIDKLASCDKMPQASRDALKKAYDQASTAWAKVPASAKAQLATACKAGADAVTTSAKSVCGW
jgi:hypothetical protein